MNYRRFVTEAEPTKPTTCSSCGSALIRSRMVWLLVAAMLITMLTASYPLFSALYENNYSAIALVALAMAWLAAWVMFVNFLSWQLIKWRPLKQSEDVDQ